MLLNSSKYNSTLILYGYLLINFVVFCFHTLDWRYGIQPSDSVSTEPEGDGWEAEEADGNLGQTIPNVWERGAG